MTLPSHTELLLHSRRSEKARSERRVTLEALGSMTTSEMALKCAIYHVLPLSGRPVTSGKEPRCTLEVSACLTPMLVRQICRCLP